MIEGLHCIRIASAEALSAARRAMASDDRWARRSLAAARRRFAEAALLATCERMELYEWSDGRGVSSDGAGCTLEGLAVASADWAHLRGVDAARHLLRVAAGLESRMLGEPHILVQVAAAAREAGSSGSGGPFLNHLFDAALRAGRRARAETGLAALAGSHAAAAAERVRRHIAGVATCASPNTTHETPPRCDAAPGGARTAIVGILGGGAMALEIADALGSARVQVFARHVVRTRAAAGERPLEVLPLATLPERVGALSALVAATTSPRPIVGRRELAGACDNLLVIDLGNPANVDADVIEVPRLTLLRIEELSSPTPAAEVLAAASAIVEQELAQFVRDVAPMEVILAAHGAGDASEANRMAHEIADRVAARRPGARVRAAFNLGAPRLSPDLLQRGDACGAAQGGPASALPPILVVPLTTSEGWFTRQRLPEMLGMSRGLAGRPIAATTPPVGSVRRLVRSTVDAVIGAIDEECARPVGRGLTVIVVGHGTARHAASGDATRALADEIRRCVGDRSGVTVTSAFLDQDPPLEEIAPATRDTARLVVPWLLGGGDHALVDLRERLCRPDDPYATRVLEPLGRSPALVDSLLALLDWHAPGRVLRLGTRRSRLARVQAELAAQRLAAAGVVTQIHLLDTEGDRDLQRSIEAFATDGPFSDDLERALAAGVVDVAVHSVKDLPLASSGDTGIAAFLPRGDAGEALVTRDGRPLAALDCGARVGTCSTRRALQLAALRPDLEIVPIRGAVDARVAAVDHGEFDAAILAVAGLERLGLAHRIAQRLGPWEILPEAGQGAIALTARVDDRPAWSACASIDDSNTRRAVEAERRVAAAIERSAGGTAPVVAVLAECSGDERVHVRVRLIERSSGTCEDAEVDAEQAEVERVALSMLSPEEVAA